MLVLRRRVLSKTATLALVRQLVDLALVSPIPVFADIINVFSIIGRESLSNRDGVDELTFNTVSHILLIGMIITHCMQTGHRIPIGFGAKAE